MLPEQQRILGYFIEEAKEHLNTIEQGLLNLQSTLDNQEMINEVFQAAHSIKEGAAMLCLNSIQHTAHRLEDCFKVLKEHPIKVDRKLESLFLGVSDTLKELIKNCTEPSGLTEEMVETLMLETESVFKWLHEHLELLVQQSSIQVTKSTNILPKTSPVTSPQPVPQKSESWQNLQTLQSQVIRTLREMLQLFKQTATPQTRQRLYECCGFLAELGEEFNWSNWCSLCRTAGSAIAHPENTYLTLAKIVITDIKQALELASTGREAEVIISQQLQALVSVEEAIELLEIPLELADELDTPASSSTFDLVTDKGIPQTTGDATYTEVLNIKSSDIITSLSELFEQFNSNDNAPLTHSRTETNNLEVGVTELNILADSFEGESSDLCRTQDKEEILDMSPEDKIEIILSNNQAEKTDNNLETVISEETISDQHKAVSTTEDLTIHVSDDLLEEKIGLSSDKTAKPEETIEITQNSSEQSINASEKIQDQVSSLLELLLDEKQPSFTDEINQIQTEILPNIELSKNQETSFDDLFLETAKNKIDSDHYRESKTISYQDKISTLEELFTKAEKNHRITSPENHSISADLFTVLPETEDFNDLWEPEVKREKGEFSPVHQQNAASELEEILLSNAAEEIFDDVAQSRSST
ncbi:MAG: Hpt domain-containing protein, partial [Brasilonema sp.]